MGGFFFPLHRPCSAPFPEAGRAAPRRTASPPVPGSRPCSHSTIYRPRGRERRGEPGEPGAGTWGGRGAFLPLPPTAGEGRPRCEGSAERAGNASAGRDAVREAEAGRTSCHCSEGLQAPPGTSPPYDLSFFSVVSYPKKQPSPNCL